MPPEKRNCHRIGPDDRPTSIRQVTSRTTLLQDNFSIGFLFQKQLRQGISGDDESTGGLRSHGSRSALLVRGRPPRIVVGDAAIVGGDREVGATRQRCPGLLHPIAEVGNRQHVAGP